MIAVDYAPNCETRDSRLDRLVFWHDLLTEVLALIGSGCITAGVLYVAWRIAG